MNVAVVQHDIVWEDATATHELVRPLVAEAAKNGARLVVLTEMFATGFSMATDRIAQAADGPSATFLAEQAVTHGVWLAASVSTALPESLPVNRLWVCGPGGERYHYDKIHPFTFADEHLHYAPGDEFVTVDIEGVRVSLFVCYDLRFADEFWARAMDTDAYLVVANWPESRAHHWRSLLVARAIENQAYVVAANRVGSGGRRGQLPYRGDSVVLDPVGESIATAAPGEVEIIYADVDPARVSDVRASFPFLQDRR